MTDETNVDLLKNKDTEPNDLNRESNFDCKDWFLSSLVNLVNDTDVTMGITLNVGGTIVSGTLIGGSEYFKGFADEIASGFSNKDAAENIRESYAQFAQMYPKKPLDEKEEDREEVHDTPKPSYIHLRDARFFANGQPSIPGNRGVWWRGRLAAVDGFSLGGLEAS